MQVNFFRYRKKHPILPPRVERYIKGGNKTKVSNLDRELIQKVEYPSGLREWIANPLFVGSNPTSTSTKYEVKNF